MKDLDEILKIVMDGIRDIDRSTITNGKILTEIEYLPIPLRFKPKNQLATIEIFRVKDNMSLFLYDIYLNFDPNGLMYVETYGHDSITIDNFAEKIEKALVYEGDEVEDLVTVYLPEGLTPGNFLDDFIMKFHHITQKTYTIRPFVPPVWEGETYGSEN